MSITINEYMDKIKNYLLWPILALALTLSTYLVLVALIHNILVFSSPEQEEILWEFVSDDLLYKQIDYAKQKKVQTLVDKLSPPHNNITILVLTSQHVNAFAAPGGRVIITTALLEKKLSEEALLFVIGHEIAHLIRKDHLYEFSKMLVAKLYGKMIRSELVTELLMLIDSYKIKETEFLADQYSSKIILDYYGDTKGAEEFFEYLIKNNKDKSSSSHPSSNKRLEKLSNPRIS